MPESIVTRIRKQALRAAPHRQFFKSIYMKISLNQYITFKVSDDLDSFLIRNNVNLIKRIGERLYRCRIFELVDMGWKLGSTGHGGVASYPIGPDAQLWFDGYRELSHQLAPAAQKGQQGWICPKCGAGNSPISSRCPCVPIPTIVAC